MNFKGKYAYITGGSSGIGYAIAEAMVKEGAHVLLISRNVERLEKAKAHLLQIAGAGIGVDILSLDVADNDATTKLLTEKLSSVISQTNFTGFPARFLCSG